MPHAANAITPPSVADAEWLRKPATQAVFAALEHAGFQGRAVGGVVRNTLMGLPVTDIDIATPARPEEVIAAATAAGLASVPTGIEHGTVTVISAHEPYEVTTLRHDVETDGRRAVVAFTDDWAADASRRDFTVNALYCDRHGVVHDPLGGYPDVARRVVRFIGDPDQRIAEDYLRILRFFRFHAVLGEGPLDRVGLDACVRGRTGLKMLSAERVRAELLKLLAGSRALEAVEAMTVFGILAVLLHVAPRPGVLARLAQAEAFVDASPDAILRLSALCLAVSEDAPVLARRLRLSNDERAALIVISRQSRALSDAPGEKAWRRLVYEQGPVAWRRSVLAALVQSPADASLATAYALPERWSVPKLPVKGLDVLALGLPAGPHVGAVLAEVERWWVDNDFPPAEAVRDRLATVVRARHDKSAE